MALETDRLLKSLTGHLLVASPQERDLDFIAAVILLIQHSEDQAFGVVLNRPMTMTVQQAWRGKSRCEGDELVYSGGPLDGPLMALHSEPSLGEIEILPSVYYSVKKKLVEQLICSPYHPRKVFQSHVGWGPGQLDRFMENGSWRTLPASPEHVFHAGPNLWEDVSKLE
jgi:putative transcriptional regulator